MVIWEINAAFGGKHNLMILVVQNVNALIWGWLQGQLISDDLVNTSSWPVYFMLYLRKFLTPFLFFPSCYRYVVARGSCETDYNDRYGLWICFRGAALTFTPSLHLALRRRREKNGIVLTSKLSAKPSEPYLQPTSPTKPTSSKVDTPSSQIEDLILDELAPLERIGKKRGWWRSEKKNKTTEAPSG